MTLSGIQHLASSLLDLPLHIRNVLVSADHAIAPRASHPIRRREAPCLRKSPVRPHHTDTSSRPWDSARAERRLSNDATERTLRREFAWVDAGHPQSETAAKFPHHDVTAEGKVGAANLRACSNGIAILNGGRGGAQIPSGDRAPIYRHLATHLRDGGRMPPSLDR